MTIPFLSGHLTEQRTNEQLNSFVCETAIEGYYYIYNNKCIVSAQTETVQLFVRRSFYHYSYMTRTLFICKHRLLVILALNCSFVSKYTKNYEKKH